MERLIRHTGQSGHGSGDSGGFWFGPRGAGIRRLTGRQEIQGFWFGPRGAGIRRRTGRQEIQGNQY